jgi:hypothetical protein
LFWFSKICAIATNSSCLDPYLRDGPPTCGWELVAIFVAGRTTRSARPAARPKIHHDRGPDADKKCAQDEFKVSLMLRPASSACSFQTCGCRGIECRAARERGAILLSPGVAYSGTFGLSRRALPQLEQFSKLDASMRNRNLGRQKVAYGGLFDLSLKIYQD